jgi:hypothetical protein
MLLCKQTHCLGIWYTLNLFPELEAGHRHVEKREGNVMSRTATAAFRAPSAGLFNRLFATIDRLLLAYAEMTVRNGDIPRHGV